MSNSLVAKVRRVPSSFLLAVTLIAAICIVSAGCHKAEGDKATATDALPLAARVDRLDGEVGIDRQNDTQDNSQDQSQTDWAKASVNTPVSVGSRVYVKDQSHAAIALAGATMLASIQTLLSMCFRCRSGEHSWRCVMAPAYSM